MHSYSFQASVHIKYQYSAAGVTLEGDFTDNTQDTTKTEQHCFKNLLSIFPGWRPLNGILWQTETTVINNFAPRPNFWRFSPNKQFLTQWSTHQTISKISFLLLFQLWLAEWGIQFLCSFRLTPRAKVSLSSSTAKNSRRCNAKTAQCYVIGHCEMSTRILVLLNY